MYLTYSNVVFTICLKLADRCYIHKHHAFVCGLQYKLLSTKEMRCKIDVSRPLKWHYNFSQALRSSSSECPIASGFESGSKSANRLNQADMSWLPLLGAIKKEENTLKSFSFEIVFVPHLRFWSRCFFWIKKKFQKTDNNLSTIIPLRCIIIINIGGD